MTVRLPSLCYKCKHYRKSKTCDAFPDEIPMEIWIGSKAHTEPYKGDHGIQYEPIEEGKEVKP